MSNGLDTTKMTTKGQVVIPQGIRENLPLKPGVKFIVVGEGDNITLKRIVEPRFERLEKIRKNAQKSPLVRKLSKLPETARIKEINSIVHSVRK